MGKQLSKHLRILTGLLALVLIAPLSSAGVLDGNSSDVMLQGFHWRSQETKPWWGVIRNNATNIKNAGFTMVWLPPASDSAAVEGYLPRQLNVFNSAYGSEADLKSAIAALHSNGVKAIADVVVNHRVGTSNWADFTNPTWGADSVCQGDEWTDATGAADTGSGFNAGRDIDHTKAYVRTSLTTWLNYKKNTLGYDGWRWDYVKGFGGSYVGTYVGATAPYFSVGELWTDLNLNDVNPHRQLIMNWIDATAGRSGAFDFTTKGILQQAVQYNEFWRLRDSEGKPQGAIGWWPAKSVTFIDNHDTGPSTPSGGQNHWPFPSDKVLQGYAYILSHPGIPTVYWVHYFDWGTANQNAIKALITARKNAGVTSTSTVSIQVADTSKYAAIITGNTKKLAVKIGPNSWSPGTGWTLVTSGTNYAVWTQ
ncbi:glucan 1,4-alpha-maltotetraohydrolase domain-containing protein [Hyalangium rubrum]|uniref:Glucan 1,4-alpha-maltotetraohydrolase domain-containing protein n=1 Tax=Hyalangium rubrum TaxID=3103134 RepID=A0ABU5H6H9_9BACT|nr:glucan 1,4-alpha-maltotetraohydrolase domain-containing protein [Hyalangium sp. s54d21]MDY7228699.1 glucan 1,4-alpha-maltotetraohydrolase domain-containing protein [Hyalangium sp. s54d21]